ncbi:GNAT family N-acetyltransferase [Anatilimnocola floriformis]|uniref:GNAT family N-acetyltransferase n=1 Tax=Anatilimnocola floriformis TaxID=2948575 RepID=UPI0020C50D6D|nr:GNAT family N-acetyltransferase [Anatilimnocola floriformis]
MFTSQLPRGYSLAQFKSQDRNALVAHLNDRELYERTLRIPFPYTAAAADEWLAIASRNDPSSINWAIRNEHDELIGGVGLDRPSSQYFSHRAELGYWLARPYWNQGIMSSVVPVVCQFAFETLAIAKVTAHVFAFNVASARVLEKGGFELEGTLKQHYHKDGQLIDSKVYGRCSDSLAR